MNAPRIINTEPRLAIVHGMWCNATHVESSFLDALIQDVSLAPHVFSLPHHEAPSEEHRTSLGKISLLDYRDFLLAKLQELNAPVILLGHSIGGLLTQMIAHDERSREFLKAIVLLTPALPAGILGFTLKSLPLLSWPLLTRGLWRKPCLLKRQVTYLCLNEQSPEIRKRYAETLVYESGQVIWECGAFWSPSHWRNTRVNLQKIQVPTLVVGARKDRMIPYRSLVRLAARIPQATFVESPGDHWAIGGRYGKEVGGLVNRWLKEMILNPSLS